MDEKQKVDLSKYPYNPETKKKEHDAEFVKNHAQWKKERDEREQQDKQQDIQDKRIKDEYSGSK